VTPRWAHNGASEDTSQCSRERHHTTRQARCNTLTITTTGRSSDGEARRGSATCHVTRAVRTGAGTHARLRRACVRGNRALVVAAAVKLHGF
jgi:hypothetical protein